MGCGAWDQGKVEAACRGCGGCHAGLAFLPGPSEPGRQRGAAQGLGQGKCRVKVRVGRVGLSEGRGRASLPESRVSRQRGQCGSGPQHPQGTRLGRPRSLCCRLRAAGQRRDTEALQDASLAPPLPALRARRWRPLLCSPARRRRRRLREGRWSRRTGGRGLRTDKGRRRPGGGGRSFRAVWRGPRPHEGGAGGARSPCPSDRGIRAPTLPHRQ